MLRADERYAHREKSRYETHGLRFGDEILS
jgi:hypothetical protein